MPAPYLCVHFLGGTSVKEDTWTDWHKLVVSEGLIGQQEVLQIHVGGRLADGEFNAIEDVVGEHLGDTADEGGGWALGTAKQHGLPVGAQPLSDGVECAARQAGLPRSAIDDVGPRQSLSSGVTCWRRGL